MPPNVQPNHNHHNDTIALLQRLTLSDYPTARRPTKLQKRIPNMDSSESPAIGTWSASACNPIFRGSYLAARAVVMGRPGGYCL